LNSREIEKKRAALLLYCDTVLDFGGETEKREGKGNKKHVAFKTIHPARVVLARVWE